MLRCGMNLKFCNWRRPSLLKHLSIVSLSLRESSLTVKNILVCIEASFQLRYPSLKAGSDTTCCVFRALDAKGTQECCRQEALVALKETGMSTQMQWCRNREKCAQRTEMAQYFIQISSIGYKILAFIQVFYRSCAWISLVPSLLEMAAANETRFKLARIKQLK